MNRVIIYRPVSKRDLKPVLVPSVQSKSLEQLISMYMNTGNVQGLESNGMDSYDFDDSEHIDFDVELPQSMNKIDAILHYRQIADSRRSPLQAGIPDPVKVDNPVSTETGSVDNNPNASEGA